MNATTALSEPRRRPGRWLGVSPLVRRLRNARNASERYVRTVWVVSFEPYRERAMVGGFDWRLEWAAADALYGQAVQDSVECGGCHIVRLSPFRSALTGDALTAEIDAHLGLIEDGGLPVAREFRP